MLLRLLARAAATRADRVAVRAAMPTGGWRDTTWARLHADVRAAAAAAARTGTRSGDGPIVVVLDGTAPSIATAAGVIAAGVDALLLEAQSSALDDPASPVPASRPRAVVTAHESLRDPQPVDENPVDEHEPGEVLQLTSGSTGEPRIVRQPLSNVLTGGRLYRRLFAVTDRDTVLAAVPVAHSYGLAGLVAALMSGATLVTLPRFGLRPLVDGLRNGATVLLGTPLLYQLLTPVLALEDEPTGLRVALSAGGPLPADTSAMTEALGTPVRPIYGITEAGLIACVPASVPDWPAGSVGFPAPGVVLRPDGDGRLAVRAPMMFAGYYGGEDRARDAFYDTGDHVRLDADGHLFVLGRKEGVVNIGGRKVSAGRIEQVLRRHTGVRDAFVFGVERPDHEQEMHAAVVLAAGTGVDDVLRFCRAQALRPYEVPHRIHALDRLPRTGMGKVDRRRVE